MRYELVVIGTSFGGLQALSTLLEGLPRDFDAAIAIVQHRSKDSDETLASLLQEHSKIPLQEAEDKVAIERGRVYLAPADYHTLVEDHSFALTVDPPVVYSRPSIDVLFETAADAYGSRLIGVVLTGANADGSRGLAHIKERGGYAIVQDPSTAASRAMPEAAIAAVKVDAVAPIEQIPLLLADLVGSRKGAEPHLRAREDVSDERHY